MSGIRFSSSPREVKKFNTMALREDFLMENLLEKGSLKAVYSMYDRMISIGVIPTLSGVTLPPMETLTKSSFFLERREMGIINIGEKGEVIADGTVYELEHKDCLYLGKGVREVTFKSLNSANPAEYFICSSPAHHAYPAAKASKSDATQVELGNKKNCNERVIYQYIHENGIQSCQLVMGVTSLMPGSTWNTFPPHTHLRRMEVYFYFELEEDQIVMHFMGDPEETRHLVVRNKQGVISPEWSIHSGVGTTNYSFVWAMAGENKAFTDMDAADLSTFK
ncbi:MAG: 5-dehydro-4-deoxy-D-glucuronate isomerase [Cyclobacteriaceae bacterium]